MTDETQDRIALKWGTLKAWHFATDACAELFRRYCEVGKSVSTMTQHDTPEQKELICQMIDECNAETIHLSWDGLDVSKDEAKRYVMDYGKKGAAS